MTLVRVVLPVAVGQFFDYQAQSADEADLGRCVEVPFRQGKKVGVIFAVGGQSTLAAEKIRHIEDIDRALPCLDAHWRRLILFVARYYHALPGELVALALPPRLRAGLADAGKNNNPFLTLSDQGREALVQTRRESRALRLLRALAGHDGPRRKSDLRAWPDGAAVADALRRGWLQETTPKTTPKTAALAETGARPELTAGQQTALDTFLQKPAGFSSWLVQGVTGSGKTELYLRMAEDALASGHQVLMLVPEIALTPQFQAQIEARFCSARVVSLHSSLAAGARARHFVAAWQGKADIVIGTRLAVFTPLPRLGLIVVDEEHDASYKQHEGVRYCARDLAVWRAHDLGIAVVLGSATPSLESWQHANSGRYHLLRLHQRARAQTLPQVRLLDVRGQPLQEGMSTALLDALALRLQRGEQSLVFINRRGYAPALACPACGWVSECPHCSARRVVHLAQRLLRCHYCGVQAELPAACPDCGNQDIFPRGQGTQRVEAFLQQHFPAARIVRVDRDATRSHTHWQQLLAAIAAGEADILVGTQLLAKGHDFSALTLVGVLGADSVLHADDFRAPERLFQQLLQVGGRAGRAERAGEVLIQTEFGRSALYQHVLRHDFDAFAHDALAEREAAAFPPFAAQAMLRADAFDYAEAEAFLARARQAALQMAPPTLRIYDIVPMRMARLARRERAQFLLEADQRQPLQEFLGRWIPWLRQLRTAPALRWQIDVDPLEV